MVSFTPAALHMLQQDQLNETWRTVNNFGDVSYVIIFYYSKTRMAMFEYTQLIFSEGSYSLKDIILVYKIKKKTFK